MSLDTALNLRERQASSPKLVYCLIIKIWKLFHDLQESTRLSVSCVLSIVCVVFDCDHSVFFLMQRNADTHTINNNNNTKIKT